MYQQTIYKTQDYTHFISKPAIFQNDFYTEKLRIRFNAARFLTLQSNRFYIENSTREHINNNSNNSNKEQQ